MWEWVWNQAVVEGWKNFEEHEKESQIVLNSLWEEIMDFKDNAQEA